MAIVNVMGLATAPLSNNDVFDEGDYIVEIRKVEQVTSREKGTPGFKFDFVIQAGMAQIATGLVPTNRHIFWTLWIPEKEGTGRNMNLSKLAQLLKACEVPPTDDFDTDMLIGKQVQVHNKPRPYNDEMQNDISKFKAVVVG